MGAYMEAFRLWEFLNKQAHFDLGIDVGLKRIFLWMDSVFFRAEQLCLAVSEYLES